MIQIQHQAQQLIFSINHFNIPSQNRFQTQSPYLPTPPALQLLHRQSCVETSPVQAMQEGNFDIIPLKLYYDDVLRKSHTIHIIEGFFFLLNGSKPEPSSGRTTLLSAFRDINTFAAWNV